MELIAMMAMINKDHKNDPDVYKFIFLALFHEKVTHTMYPAEAHVTCIY